MKKIAILAAAVLLECCAQQPVLTVSGGQIQGVPSEAPGVTVFRGIPYAAPPVGEFRWQAPQPVVPWEGVKVCDSFGPIAPQPGNKPGTFYGDEFYWQGTPEESEDCLYLNVWAPSKTLGKKADLPVALWIHGGAYMNGYGYEVTMDGDEWAKRGVILVTINYRLGTLGFLSHPELTAQQGQSGNYGTMDQAAALRWVHDNIGQFGGDPSRITIFGQSAGAMSVKTLLVSPLSRNLMAGAIIQSGGGLNTRGLSPDGSQEQFDAVGKAAMDNAGFTNLADMRAATTEQIRTVQAWFMPHPDGKVVTGSFEEAFFDGSIAQVPILIGYNKDDMGALGGEVVDRFCALRDSLGCTVYEYEFLRELPTDESHPASAAGAFHSAELWYMFGTLDRSWRPFIQADHALSVRMLDAWTDFCKSGNPGWPAYKQDKPYKECFNVE
ncbi:MAG: carboxylesterase family protein [Bacteroidales bacterium]|nr:carboxylesterase family protein [Bacteroidales bacterium]